MGEEAAPWPQFQGHWVTLAAVCGQVWASAHKRQELLEAPRIGSLPQAAGCRRGDGLRGMKRLPLLHRPFQLLLRLGSADAQEAEDRRNLFPRPHQRGVVVVGGTLVQIRASAPGNLPLLG